MKPLLPGPVGPAALRCNLRCKLRCKLRCMLRCKLRCKLMYKLKCNSGSKERRRPVPPILPISLWAGLIGIYSYMYRERESERVNNERGENE